ncbi:MAG TPA: sugar transferase [Dinghuibacter sp.]|uniref:sugar transferase n=1 Tax=Dinghuibacter sp. TaxID=2024697 RepID=UPI002C8D4A88|nr:sugar transferase [Dinghuibacter sp.]HTJ10978.1 sugar transferase [Dinghuibacter sp.]
MYLFIKRAFDFLFSLILCLILLPFMLPIIIILKCTGEGYVFYLQKRIGLNNRYFNIIKFATMLKNSPNMGTGSITLRNDPRLLPLGKFLRKTKINEIPQILNVLKGDMSLVGPRPLVDRTFNAYPEAIRNKVYVSKPGITGIGSIVFRDEEKMISESGRPPHEYYEDVIAPYKGALEMWYNEHKSLYVDFMILFITGWVILFPESDIVHKAFKGLPDRALLSRPVA